MKLAIIIGISSYQGVLQKLPSCIKDASLIAGLLSASKKFDDILVISDESASSVLKSKLAQFIQKYKSQKIDELVFYYTGHGDLHQEGFHFLLADFAEERRQQTSLSNDELDAMLRSLQPELTVKIVDACHSGITYVKEADALSKSLTKSQDRYKLCYFMFSSLEHQQSFQDKELSYFTRSIIDCVAGFKGPEIRYRDVMDYIADEFHNSGIQTPFFLVQAANTELFINVGSEVRDYLDGTLHSANDLATAGKNAGTPAPRKLLEIVKAKSSEYCTKEEAMQFFSSFADSWNKISYSGEVGDLYDFTAEIRKDQSLVRNASSIGSWVKENKHIGLFASETYKQEKYSVQVPKMRGSRYSNSLYAVISPSLIDPEFEMVERTRDVISGFISTAETPFRSAVVEAKPKFENLPPAALVITFVFSKSKCFLFHMTEFYQETDWGRNESLGIAKWYFLETPMKPSDKAHEAATTLVNLFKANILRQARERLGIGMESDEEVAPKPVGKDVAGKSEKK